MSSRSLAVLSELVLPAGIQIGPFGSQLKASEYCEEGVPVVMPQDIAQGRIRDDSIARVPDTTATRLHRHLLQEGDLVFARRGELGRVAVVDASQAGWVCGTGCLRARLNRRLVLPEYVAQYMTLPRSISWLERNALGQTMLNLNTEILGQLPVPLADLEAQKQVVTNLRLWQHALDLVDSLVLATRERYRHLVDTVCADRSLPLAKVHSVTREVSARNRGLYAGPVLSVTNRAGFERPEDRFARRVAGKDLNAYKLIRRGEYAYNPSRFNVGSIGRLDEWNLGLLSPMYVVFALDERRVDSDFFLHWLSSSWARGHIGVRTQGSVRDSVGFSDFGSISIHMPSLQCQRHVAQMLNDAKREFQLHMKLRAHLASEKQGLLAEQLGDWVST